MLTPARIPVTAGKKTANTWVKVASPEPNQEIPADGPDPFPRKKDRRESAIMVIVTYCSRMARLVLLNAAAVMRMSTIEPIRRLSSPGIKRARASVKPTM